MGAGQSSRREPAAPTEASAAVAAATIPPSTCAASTGSPPEKLGAGLLLTCGGEVLLLQRAGKHNHGTWGLPGGNCDRGDGGLLGTAQREAGEEMGPNLPPLRVLAEVLTKRGKRGQKHYTVFVASISPESRATWRPQLNEEHSAWRWFSLAELQSGRVALHPVVALALRTSPHRETVLAAIGAPGVGAQ